MIALVASLAMMTAAPTDAKVTVVVLYFDNNSPQREYDVLQKGLADMMVTDLAAVPALQLVEREKLQKLVDELKLQNTAYFDPKTAQKMGKGLGAQFAVTGAITAIAPQMRIDIRLIEVATARIVFTEKVAGASAEFFDLQQELVDRFVTGLNVKLTASQRAKSGAIDINALVTYSQGLDSVDKGDLAGASKKLAAVVQNSPQFALGKSTYDDILKRLAASADKRSTVLSANETDFVNSIEAHIRADRPEEVQLAYRKALGHYLTLKMEQLVGPPRSALRFSMTPTQHRPEMTVLMRRYLDNAVAVDALWNRVRRRDARVEDADAVRARSLDIPDLADGPRLIQFLLFGEFPRSGRSRPHGEHDLTLRPTLAQLDPKMADYAFALIEHRLKVIAAENKAWGQREIGEAFEQRAEGLILLGRKEEAIATWQSYLDKYPTGDRYKAFEKNIQDLLGVSPAAKDFEQKLEACGLDLGNNFAIAEATKRATRAGGVPGLRAFFERVQAKCKKTLYGPGFLGHLDYWGSIESISRLDCSFHKEALARAKASGNQNSLDPIVAMGVACP